MAAFPPPALNLHIPEPLRDVFRLCEEACVPGCCGLQAFDISSTHIITHGAKFFNPAHWGESLRQFEVALNSVLRHPGPIDTDEMNGYFNHTWPTPHDCLSYFADWRREIAVALSHVPGFFDPRWRTETVTLLAKGIEADRAFDRLPILADALEEAGCDQSLVLTHLREPYDHAHHCWVVDLLSFGGRSLAE